MSEKARHSPLSFHSAHGSSPAMTSIEGGKYCTIIDFVNKLTLTFQKGEVICSVRGLGSGIDLLPSGEAGV